MGTYYIPRNYKGETRILYIFSIKSLITTALGAAVGAIFFFLFKALAMQKVGIVLMAIFAVIGYVIGAVKIPTIVSIPVTKKIGGEPISEIIIRYIKFKKKRKIYTYCQSANSTKEEK
jgi:predicted membrane-bound spermidine synthase